MSKGVPFPELVTESNHSLIKEQVTKEKIGEFVDNAVQSVTDGNADALDLYMRAKITSEMASDAMKKLKPKAMQEAEKYGKEELKMYGCAIEITAGTTSYSYENSEEWCKIRGQIQEAAFRAGGTVVDDNGEIVPTASVKSGSASALRVTIPKK
jgi:hypothetical protein